MVTVVKRGIAPDEVQYNVTCRSCKSELTFLRGEAEYHHDWREGDFLSIACPVCRNTVTCNVHPQSQPSHR